MKKVIFRIPQALDEKIESYIKRWGFTTKAEFFRHAATVYLDEQERMMAARKLGQYTNNRIF